RKYRTLLGDTTRSFEKMFKTGAPNKRRMNILIDVMGAIYQVLFVLLNKLSRKGDAIVVIAKKT
ncbi:MAG: hypothetical protein ACP5NO_08655, partial [Thermoplasmata archaeon]